MKQNNFYLRWQKAAGAAKSEQRSRSIRTAAPGIAVVAAALLGWGGLSVHCQTASVLDGTNVPLDRYFLGKALQSLLSALLAAALWHVIPPAA